MLLRTSRRPAQLSRPSPAPSRPSPVIRAQISGPSRRSALASAASRCTILAPTPGFNNTLFRRWISSFESAIEIRPGTIIQHKGKFVEVIKAQHSTGAQRSYGMQMEFKDLATGSKGLDRFKSDEEVEVIELEGKQVTYVGPSGKKAYKFKVTDEEDEIKEVEIPAAIFPAHVTAYLNDDIIIHAGLHEGKVLKWRLEAGTKIPVKVKDAGFTSDKTTHSTKNVTLENGRQLKVPVYIETGDVILVNIETEAFVSRV